MHEAKAQFSRLVDAAANGEEIVIAKAGKPAARLVPRLKKKRASEEARPADYQWIRLSDARCAGQAATCAPAAADSCANRCLDVATCEASTGRSTMMARNAAVRSITATV
nr:type II toxin-antitoxin system prevent-host-death family antitoxin [Cupriavidus oxalaticus]